jgi:hypothetical protein
MLYTTTTHQRGMTWKQCYINCGTEGIKPNVFETPRPADALMSGCARIWRIMIVQFHQCWFYDFKFEVSHGAEYIVVKSKLSFSKSPVHGWSSNYE